MSQAAFPSLEEAEAFLDRRGSEQTRESDQPFARKCGLCGLLRQQVERDPPQQAPYADIDKRATFAFHDWIRESLHQNKPYDEFVREILTASGEVGKNPPVAWYREK